MVIHKRNNSHKLFIFFNLFLVFNTDWIKIFVGDSINIITILFNIVFAIVFLIDCVINGCILRSVDIKWFVLAIISVVYNPGILNGDLEELYIPLITILIIIVSRLNNYEWITFSYKIIFIMSALHMLATIIFFINPSLCESYRIILAARTNLMVDNLGFKSALTSQYGINSFYVAICVFTSFTKMLYAKGKTMFFSMVMFFVSVFSFLLLSKRGGTVGIALAIVIVLFIKNKNILKHLKTIIYVSFAIFVLFLVSINVPEIAKVIYRFYNQTDISNNRFSLWGYAIEMFLKRPLLGYGWNSFYFNTNDMVHSLYFQLLYEIGIIGTPFVLSIFISSVIGLIKYIRKKTVLEAEDGRVLLFSLCYQFFFFFQGFTTNVLSKQFYIVYIVSVFFAVSIIGRNYKQKNVLIDATKLEYTPKKYRLGKIEYES